MVITGVRLPYAISLKSNSLTVSIGEPASVFSYDLAGRLYSVFRNGVTYRCGLNGSILAKWRDSERERRWLSPPEIFEIESYAHQSILNFYHEIQSELPEEICAALQRAIDFDAKKSADCFHQIYKPIGILPPDRYLSTVLQMTEGCSCNTCTFCTFYKDRPFRIKSPVEFRQHAQAVKNFLGDGLSLRPTIFLGDANALVVPMQKLLPLIDVVHQVFGARDLYAFLDGFSGEKKSVPDYALLKNRGLKRVYIGLESGSHELLHLLQKPGTPEDAIQAVHAMKAGGVAVSVIVLPGAGGQEFSDAHIRETARVLNEMALDKNDILYFSPLIVSDEMPYARQNFQPIDGSVQGEAIQHQLTVSPKISCYDIREFIY